MFQQTRSLPPGNTSRTAEIEKRELSAFYYNMKYECESAWCGVLMRSAERTGELDILCRKGEIRNENTQESGEGGDLCPIKRVRKNRGTAPKGRWRASLRRRRLNLTQARSQCTTTRPPPRCSMTGEATLVGSNAKTESASPSLCSARL